jgi:hypothetical protein
MSDVKELPKVKMNWDIDGNTFSILGTFKKAAKKAGWSKEDIDKVTKEAMSGDYDHVIQTIMKYE